MITNFNKYLLLESSTFDKLGFPKKFINTFYKEFFIKNNNFKIKKLDTSILLELKTSTRLYLNKSYLYYDNNIEKYLVFRFFSYDSVDFLYYYMDEVIIDNKNLLDFLNVYIKDTDVNNWYEIVDLNIEYNFDFYENDKEGNKTKKILHEVDILPMINHKFRFDYTELFKNLFSSYLKIIKKHFSEVILNTNDIEIEKPTNDILYYNEIKHDFELLLTLKADPISHVSFTEMYRNAYNTLYNKYNIKIYTLREEYEFVKKHLQEFSNEYAKYFYKEITNKLYFFKLKKYDKELEVNPALWKDIKDNIYDKKLKDKWKHLDNCSNFDLI